MIFISKGDNKYKTNNVLKYHPTLFKIPQYFIVAVCNKVNDTANLAIVLATELPFVIYIITTYIFVMIYKGYIFFNLLITKFM